MLTEAKPTGELFSRVYLDKGTPTQDSKRFRRRLCNYLTESVNGASFAGESIAVELGLRLPKYHSAWPRFFEEMTTSEMLDSITLFYRAIKTAWKDDAAEFLQFVARAFSEENLGYRIDERGGIHFFVDQEFESSRSSLLAGLQLPRYAAAREAFEAAHSALGGARPDTLTAVRRAFDAVENVFKLMFNVPRIGASEIKAKLKPHLDTALSGRSRDASKLIAGSLAEWVNAAHQFRHAPSVPDPSPPPSGLALAMVGSAASYLRWLAELDAAHLAKATK